MKNSKKGRKALKVIGIVLCCIILIIAVGFGLFVYNNTHYYQNGLKSISKAGFVEKQVELPDGSIINYGEGGSGQVLLLIHGQGVSWEDYFDVLPQLSKKYHIYAVDCYGHGESSHNPEKYSAKAIGEDLIWFIENVIKEPVVVSGHSSGGLLTAWLAANSKENVKGVVLEDPPFFSCEKDRTEKTFAYLDSFLPIHNFLNQSETDDYSLYYIQNCRWLTFFGDSRDKIIKSAEAYRAKHPDKPIEIFYLPPSITRMFYTMDKYDPKFGDTFYDCSWMDGFDHAETLDRIECPAILIHTNWSIDKEGVLQAAMSGEDAERACSLISDCKIVDIKSGHDSHAEKPEEFIKVMMDLLNRIDK